MATDTTLASEAREAESGPKILRASQVANRIGHFAPVLLAILLIYTFIRALVAAMGKLYWYDELLTKLVVAQKTWVGMMSAVRAPVDTQPPLFYLVERLSTALFPNLDLALRVPSAIGMVCTVLCVFLYLRRARGVYIALLSALFCLMTVQFTFYAQEARPYSLLVACTAFALVCYQRADKMSWLVLLGATLALAESLHYLAVLMMVPFGLAESYRIYATRRVRWGVWIALTAGVAALLPSWNILLLNRAYYGPNHFSMHFSLFEISHIYGEILVVATPIGTAVAATLVAALLVKTNWQMREAGGIRDEIQETVLVVALIALPFVEYAFAKATHGGLLARYALPAVVGLALALGIVLASASKRTLFLVGVFMISAVALREIHFWRFAAQDRETATMDARKTGEFILAGGHTDLPVVVPDGNILRMVEDGFPVDHRRLFYLVSIDHTMDKGMRYAQRFVPVQVRNQDEFLANNPRFLFFVQGPDVRLRALPSNLARQGWTVEQMASDDELRELDLVYKRP